MGTSHVPKLLSPLAFTFTFHLALAFVLIIVEILALFQGMEIL